jgi:hypothetical protein
MAWRIHACSSADATNWPLMLLRSFAGHVVEITSLPDGVIDSFYEDAETRAGSFLHNFSSSREM